MSRRSKPSAIVEGQLSPDKWLAFAYVPARNRAAIEALFAIDGAMGDVLRGTSDPMVGQIRLAWWRERLEELDRDAQAPAEPRLQAIERLILPRGIKARELASLENGWLRLFDEFPWEVGTAEAIWFRGRLLFALAAQLLGRTGDEIEGAGGLWALVDAARHCSDPASRAMLVTQAKTFAQGLSGTRFPAPLRPLSMLAALAVRDCYSAERFEREGSAARAGVLLRHRLSGKLPQRKLGG